MSLFDTDPLARAGQLACLCGPDLAPADRPWRQPGTLQLAAGFGLAVLAQALVAGMLPLAGRQLAPDAGSVAWPFAAMLLGAVTATLPASFLLDTFGRRAAFALGASLGVAGGLILAFALVQRHFGLLCLGAFWLGIAQGFGLFYRHAGATGLGGTPAATAMIFGAGALAGFAGPWLATFAEGLSAPFTLLGTAFAASGVQVAALALAAATPSPPVRIGVPDARDAPPLATLVLCAAISASAWAVMAASMATAPLAMADCGIAGGAIAGTIAWHLVAMYAPGLALPRLAAALGALPVAALGLGLTLVGAFGLAQATGGLMFPVAMALVGAGWACAVSGATFELHARGRPGPLMLGAHDALCLAAALGGVLVSARL